MEIFFGRKKISVRARTLSTLGKYKGLMFTSQRCENLLFEFRREGTYGIHSYFVFYPFLAVWLDKRNRVVDWRVVQPFTTIVKPSAPFVRLLEFPFNDENHAIFRIFVGKRKGLNI